MVDGCRVEPREGELVSITVVRDNVDDDGDATQGKARANGEDRRGGTQPDLLF